MTQRVGTAATLIRTRHITCDIYTSSIRMDAVGQLLRATMLIWGACHVAPKQCGFCFLLARASGKNLFSQPKTSGPTAETNAQSGEQS